MTFKKRFTPFSVDLIRHMPPQVKQSLRALSDKLVSDPYLGKPLRDDLHGFYSVKHNRYRLIYEVNNAHKTVVIHYLGQRESVYEEFSRLVKEMKQRQ